MSYWQILPDWKSYYMLMNTFDSAAAVCQSYFLMTLPILMLDVFNEIISLKIFICIIRKQLLTLQTTKAIYYATFLRISAMTKT